MIDPAQIADNTDREIWRAEPGDYYADSVHVTKGGGIGINVGGRVVVKTPREWVELAWPKESALRASLSETTGGTPAEKAPIPFRHWSKDELVPYAGCACATCKEGSSSTPVGEKEDRE